MVMPIADRLPRCEPFRLAERLSPETEEFFGVLRAAPSDITESIEGPLQRFMARARDARAFARASAGASRAFELDVEFRSPSRQDKLDAEVLAKFGNIVFNAYRNNGAEELLRALLTIRWASLQLAPGFESRLSLADTLFDLCRHDSAAASVALKLFLAAEGDFRKTMCNAKIVLLFKQLDLLADAEAYVAPCGLSVAQLHLQNPQVASKPWWGVVDKLPQWIRNLASHAHVIRADLRHCLESDPTAFDDSANDWFFVGSRQQWTGLNLMHSKHGWQRWCDGCARKTCERLRWRRELNPSLWSSIQSTLGAGSPPHPPPMYVNFYALAPGAHIIPHLGNDLRLTIHLALEVPPRNQSRVRVADETVNYTHPGQLLIFDDAYDHEVWNDASMTRYVLGITIWHPSLLERLPAAVLQPEVPSHGYFMLCWGSNAAAMQWEIWESKRNPKMTEEMTEESKKESKRRPKESKRTKESKSKPSKPSKLSKLSRLSKLQDMCRGRVLCINHQEMKE